MAHITKTIGGISMLTMEAPAKLNLTLEVLGRRGDGFHEIRSILQTIDLCDRLRFQPTADIEFTTDSPTWKAEASLVYKAAHLLKQATGSSRGAKVAITKRIPLLSGLGGDSSDAAATLRGLNQLWELDLPRERLLQMAARLGSDVAFFLYGGTALVEGRGERVTPILPLPRRWVVLVVPPVPRLPGKTGRLYQSLGANHYTDGQITRRLVEAITTGSDFPPHLIFNTFENVAFDFFPELETFRGHILKAGATHIHLAGSGPALFTMLKDKTRAEDLYLRLKQQGLEIYLVGTVGG